jgi:endo-1,4-beta-xylanase
MKKNSFKMSKLTRRSLLRVVFVLMLALVISSFAVNAATPTGTRLKNIQSRVLIGTEFPSNFNSMSDTATFTSMAAAEFNIVTPENAMKWDATEPSQNSFNYGDSDRLVSWAQANGMKVHGHTLVWHSQTPSWAQNLSASALQSAMYNHIDKVMGHFKGKILVWDVVNEAFNEDGSYRTSFWYNKLGKSFIENAFIRARAADPSAKLIYNDYNLEATGGKSNGAYNMLKDFKTRGIPVDGIGFQMHLDIQYSFNYNDFASNLQRFADLGLEIYITEMDVRVSSNPSSSELQTQANYYQGVIQKCMAQPAVKAIQFWGFTDKYSWVPGTFPGRGAALIFDSNYNPKPSYYSSQSAIGNGPVITPSPTPARTATPIRTATPVRTATPTPGTGTPAPTVMRTPTPTTGTGTIKVQFYNQSKTDPSNQLYLNFQLVNTGSSAVSLSNIKIRYWYTEDGTQAQSFWCDYSPVGSSSVTGVFGKLSTAKTGADTYVEVGFSSSAGSVNAGAGTQVQCRCAKSDWSNYTQSNDYSFNSSASSYVDWTKVTGYVSGALAWGSEP